MAPPANSLLLKVTVFTLVIYLVGCSGSSPEQARPPTALSADTAPGVILIDTLESGRTEHYWQYEVQPSAGLVRVIDARKFPSSAEKHIPAKSQQATGAIQTCTTNPEAISPDGKYLAQCRTSKLGEFDQFFVIGGISPGSSSEWKPQGSRAIKGFAWAPNSHSIAILNTSSYYGKSPLERLFGLFGHPVPHDTIFLDIMDARTGAVTEYLLRKNVVYGLSRILNWSDESKR